MGMLRAISAATKSTFADQWKDIITAGEFDEHTVIVPGYLKSNRDSKGSNTNATEGVISNGSKIYIPENTAVFIFSDAGIENILTTAGGYEYLDGQESLFNGDGFKRSIIDQVKNRVKFGGISVSEKKVAFVNLREIRDIKFGTRGPQVYNDIFYGCDLEIYAYGQFSIKITDVEKFVCNFVPPNVLYYTFDDKNVRAQITSDFIQSFIVALNSLSKTYRISQLPSQANEISRVISRDNFNAGTWKERFGFEVVQVSIENIEFSPQSRELVNKYNSNKMELKAYEDISQRASDVSAQQKIATGVENNGFGDMGGMIFGMQMAQTTMSNGQVKREQSAMSLDEQIEYLKKLKELVDAEILSQEEFEIKKKQILCL